MSNDSDLAEAMRLVREQHGNRIGLVTPGTRRPSLHYLSPLRQLSRAIVGPPKRITHHMCQLVLDVVGSEAQHIIQDCPCHGAEALHGHPIRL